MERVRRGAGEMQAPALPRALQHVLPAALGLVRRWKVDAMGRAQPGGGVGAVRSRGHAMASAPQAATEPAPQLRQPAVGSAPLGGGPLLGRPIPSSVTLARTQSQRCNPFQCYTRKE